MNEQTDAELLGAYAEHGAEAAFAELVRRHVDFVYSAALRMVGDSHLAQDVTQGVFVALAKNASQLTHHAVLAGWLHRTARNIAGQAIRTDVRRRHREQEAAAMTDLLSITSDTPWENIAPHLDAALGELSEADRDAILLRYFEKKSAGEMAGVLGISEEAAQKRVNRAVERLREFFAKRGVAVGAAGLIVIISANGVQAAPAGLAVAITSATLTGVTISTTVTATKIIAMTTIQKIAVAATVALLTGAGLYEAHQTTALRAEMQTLQAQQTPLAEALRQLQQERDDATNRIAGLRRQLADLKKNNLELMKLRGEVTQLQSAKTKNADDDTRVSVLKSWLAREDQLKQLAQQYPNKALPEFQLLSEQQWLDAAMNAKFDSDQDVQNELAGLRRTAQNNFAGDAEHALQKYAAANDGKFPADLSQLQPYFSSPMDEAILNRWEVAPASAAPSTSVGDPILTERSPVDPTDSHWAIGVNGYGSSDYTLPEVSAAMAALQPAREAYAAANSGVQPTSPTQMLPFLTTAEEQAAYQTLLNHSPTNH